jgi:hypothetical protein
VVFAFLLVALSQQRGGVLVVIRQGGEGFVGHAAFGFLAPGEADDGVAALDVVVEEVERFAGVVGFQPEGDLAEFHSQRVQIDAVDAFANDVADGGTESRWAMAALRRCDDGEFGGDAARGGEQDVAGAAGDVGDAQVEQRLGGVRGLERVGDQVVERVLDEGLDEVVRGVVGAGGGALVALGEVNSMARVPTRTKRVIQEHRLVFEQTFIDRAEFFDVEGGVVDADGLAVFPFSGC